MRGIQQVSLSKDWSSRYVELFFWVKQANGKYAVPIAEDYKEIEDGDIQNPILRLTYDVCQDIISELWQLGFRPTKDTTDLSINSTIEAHKQHINDLRLITTKLLDKVQCRILL